MAGWPKAGAVGARHGAQRSHDMHVTVYPTSPSRKYVPTEIKLWEQSQEFGSVRQLSTSSCGQTGTEMAPAAKDSRSGCPMRCAIASRCASVVAAQRKQQLPAHCLSLFVGKHYVAASACPNTTSPGSFAFCFCCLLSVSALSAPPRLEHRHSVRRTARGQIITTGRKRTQKEKTDTPARWARRRAAARRGRPGTRRPPRP